MSETVQRQIDLNRHIGKADLPAVRRFLDGNAAHLPGLLDAGGAHKGDLDPPLVQAAALAGIQALEIAQCLLAAGAPVDRPGTHGATALAKALELRNLALAQVLLDAGASPHAASHTGVRVFDRVLACGDRAWVQRFLDEGHTLDHTSQEGITCLHWAARSNDLGLYDMVRERTGLAPDLPTQNGYRPVDLVTSLALFQHMRAHCPGMAWDVAFKSGDHSLHVYADKGAADIVRALLEHGVDPELAGRRGNRPLHKAAGSGSLATVQALLAAKAKPSARNVYSFTPLHWAAQMGHLDIVRCLVEHKANLNAKGSETVIIQQTHTPLYVALENGHGDVARYLLEQGADPNVLVDSSQSTALYEAVGKDDLALCTALLDHGASPNGIGKDGPFDFFSFPLQQCRSAAMVDLLVARGADVAGRNTQYLTALHSAVEGLGRCASPRADEEDGAQGARRQGMLDTIAALLRHGADPHAQPAPGATPLAMCKDPQAIAMLVEAMKRPDRAPAQPQPSTAKQQAAQDERRGWVHGLAGLLSGKAKAKPKPRATRSALGAALYMQCKEVGKTQAELDGVAQLLASADSADAEYISEDDYDSQRSTLHRLLDATRRSRYDTAERPRVAAYQPLVARLLELGSATLNHKGGTWGETPLHTVLRAALYSEPAGSAEAQSVVEADYRALVDMLLLGGAMPNAENDESAQPLDLAFDPAMAELLRHHGARAGRYPLALFHAIEQGDAPGLERVLACEPPLEGLSAQEQDGLGASTPLLWAALYNRLDMLRRLAGLGASLDARTEGGLGLLHMAARHGSVETLQYLVEHTALDLNALDAKGVPALHYLLASAPHSANWVEDKVHRERIRGCAEQLVAQGARIDLVDREGGTLADLVPKSVLAKLERAAKSASAGAAGRRP